MATSWYQDTQVRHALLIYLVSIVLNVGYYAYRRFHQQSRQMNLLTRVYVQSPLPCNGWCVLHFTLYLLLGFVAPSYWHILILIGILFEVLEHVLSKRVPNSHLSEPLTGRLHDIVVNALGVGAGIVLRVAVHR